jgi:hypothetical protein
MCSTDADKAFAYPLIQGVPAYLDSKDDVNCHSPAKDLFLESDIPPARFAMRVIGCGD